MFRRKGKRCLLNACEMFAGKYVEMKRGKYGESSSKRNSVDKERMKTWPETS